MLHAASRFAWDLTAVLEAVGAAQSVLWMWDPAAGCMRLTGATRALGLGPVSPACTADGLLAMVDPEDRGGLHDLLQPAEPGQPIATSVRMRNGRTCTWRGLWLEEGGRAAGVVSSDASSAAMRHDPLTGLLDRASFIAALRERGGGEGRVLVVADLDRLRRLNEALGHARADQVLAALGARLSAAFPADCLPARVGEDEFAVLAQGEAAVLSERLRQALEAPLRIAGFDIFPTLSVGAVDAAGDAGAAFDPSELLRRAELAVESAKTHGGGAAAAYGGGLESDGLSRLALEADLRSALGRGELEPFYQPIVRLRTGAIAGFEALIRWRHPRRGLVSPDDFLPMAEEMGLMPEIGRMMVARSARQLSAWLQAHQVPDLFVSVNLSTEELDQPGLVEVVGQAIAGADLPKGALKVEITEGQIMRDPEKAAGTLHALRNVGASLALDDFGTGFSSLSYLTRLPFDTLKIDRYFVKTMAANEGSAKIVRSVAALGRDLSLEIVAEGVENAGMARALLGMGCHYGQGFGYAPALTAQDAEVYLNESWVDGAAPLRARG